MHLFSVLISAAILGAGFAQASTLVERATVNGPCTGAGGAPGVCISTTDCTAGGGRHILNACPGTPDNIRCCTKTSCGNGGNCRFTSQCSGTSVSNLCPGPASFKCCQSSSNPPDCYPTPPFPAVGACKQAAVDGARKIVAANRCKVREVQCTRNCPCPSDSDHCCGLATDLMVSSAGGVRTTAGESVAEWVMNNRATLKLKYVIWGQRIWNPSRDAVKPWSQWRLQDDKGDNTLNHWDHVHVSYNA